DDAQRGRVVFNANCATCHINGNGTDNNNGGMHFTSETERDAAYASQTTQKQCRTTPCPGLWQHPPYFHDGSAKDLDAVVAHYVKARNLRLSDRQKKDLVEYLKTL